MPHSESTMSNNTEADHFDREDVEAVADCLGDDAAQLREENGEDERAVNMDRAASMLTWMLLTHPAYSAGAQPAAQMQQDIERGADFLEQYAGYIRTVHPDDIERHPYLPELEEVASQLRALSASPHPAPQQPDARDALVRELVEALQLGRAHAKWSADRSKDVTERRLNQRDVDSIDAALSKVPGATS